MCTFALATLLTVAATTAAAQPVSRRVPLRLDPTRGFISINGGYQGTTTEFSDAFNFTRDQETGTTRLTYPVEAGALFEVAGGVRLWRQVGAGAAVSRFIRDGLVSTASSVPHPLYLDRHRQVAGDGTGIRRDETGLHMYGLYMLPVRRNLHLTVMAGPSLLRVNQALVFDVNYREEYPYDEATFTGVDSNRKEGSKVGFNAGADVRWMFARHIGAGLLVRFSRSNVDLEPDSGRTLRVRAGGAHVGAGIRVAF